MSSARNWPRAFRAGGPIYLDTLVNHFDCPRRARSRKGRFSDPFRVAAGYIYVVGVLVCFGLW